MNTVHGQASSIQQALAQHATVLWDEEMRLRYERMVVVVMMKCGVVRGGVEGGRQVRLISYEVLNELELE